MTTLDKESLFSKARQSAGFLMPICNVLTIQVKMTMSAGMPT